MEKKKILFISSSMPPSEESQTIRNVYFLSGLVRQGVAVDVITQPGGHTSKFMQDGMPSEVAVFYTDNLTYDILQSYALR